MVYGDNKAYNVALIVPDHDAVQSFARAAGLGEGSVAELVEHPLLRQQFTREIARVSSEFKGYERVRAFAFAPEPFTQDNGTVTPSLKLKRHEIMRRWGGLLEELYSAHEGAEPKLTSPQRERRAV
jgi:long-chain acyl-CoA synthetase